MSTKLKPSERADMELKPGPSGKNRYQLKAPMPPTFWVRVGCWMKDATAHRRRLGAVRAWYLSVGSEGVRVKPEPKRAVQPTPRTQTEREWIRRRLTQTRIAQGRDPETGEDAGGFNEWGGHALLRQTPQNAVHPLTNKRWSPTGFLPDGIHARTKSYYDEDGVDAKGFFAPDENGHRVSIYTGTVFGLNGKTWAGESEEEYWANHVEWRTPEVEEEIRRERELTERNSGIIRAELAEEARIGRKVRMAQRRDARGRYVA